LNREGSPTRLPEQRRRGLFALSPLAISLLLFALANGILINAALPHLPWQPQHTTTLDYTEAYLERSAHSDSWKPMRTALFYVDQPRERPVYTFLWFENKVRFQYPPSSLLVLEALRLLPVERTTGDELLNGISWWATVLLAIVVARIFHLSRRRYGDEVASRSDEALYFFLALLTTLTFYPVVRGYYLGQIQVWIDLLIACVVWAWLKDRLRVAGVLVSIICVIKPTLALVVVWAVLRRHWDFVAGFAIPMTAFALISLGMYGWTNHVDYLRVLADISRLGEAFHPNQSANGLLNRFFENGNSLEWSRDAFVPYHPWVHAGTVLSTLALFALGLGFGHRRSSASAPAESHDPLDLAIVILCSTLAAPTAWTHHYGVTLPLFALALPAVLALGRQGQRGLLIALVAAFMLISNNYRVLNRLADTPLNFLQSYVYFGGLLFLAVLCLSKRSADRRAKQAAAQSSATRASASRS
jgi:alpha-1,2-mannosyltransferase